MYLGDVQKITKAKFNVGYFALALLVSMLTIDFFNDDWNESTVVLVIVTCACILKGHRVQHGNESSFLKVTIALHILASFWGSWPLITSHAVCFRGMFESGFATFNRLSLSCAANFAKHFDEKLGWRYCTRSFALILIPWMLLWAAHLIHEWYRIFWKGALTQHPSVKEAPRTFRKGALTQQPSVKEVPQEEWIRPASSLPKNSRIRHLRMKGFEPHNDSQELKIRHHQ